LMRLKSSKRRYEVGYGRPPKHAQFAKGKSGNPKGRPKSIANLDQRIEWELDKTISVKIGGRNVILTKREAIIKQVLKMAAKGDLRALEYLIRQERDRNPRPLKPRMISIIQGHDRLKVAPKADPPKTR
jgi:Family of unknown function (DUF5681)